MPTVTNGRMPREMNLILQQEKKASKGYQHGEKAEQDVTGEPVCDFARIEPMPNYE